MSKAPGTNWGESFKEYAARKAQEDSAELVVPADFLPRCLDCGYDLSGLEDGRCPECGQGFTHKNLYAAFVYRQKEKARKLSNVRHLPLIVLLLPVFSGLSIETYLGYGVNAAFLLTGSVAWFALNRGKFIEGSHWLLILLPSLYSMLVGVSTVEHGFPGMCGTAALMVAVCFVALRGSPLIASLILGVFGILPLGFFSAWLLMDSYSLQRRALHWSNFDYPAYPRWRMFTAVQAETAGWIMIALVALIAVCTALVAKRSATRLRRRRELASARAA